VNFQTTDNEVASDYFADTPITNDLLEELKKPSDGDRKDLVTLCREFERELAEKTNEVARLRELLNRALECLKVYGGSLGIAAAKQIFEELAPAPEEPVFTSAELFAQNKENTPRVDALYFRFHTHAEIVDLARSLERENAELVQALKSLQARLG